MKNLKRILFSIFILLFLTIMGATISFVRSLTPSELLIGATSSVFIIPSSFFLFYITQFDAIPINYYTDSGLTALQYLVVARGESPTADHACLKIIEYLVKRGANLNAITKDKLGLTPLHLAVLHKDFELVQRLLQLGANPNILAQGEKYYGMTSLRFARELDLISNDLEYKDIIDFISENGGQE